MSKDPTMRERVERLPQWAQEYIKDLKREREAALKTLAELLDTHKKGQWTFHTVMPTRPITFETFTVDACRCEVKHLGVNLSIILSAEEFRLSWGAGDRLAGGDVAFIPTGRQQANLVSKERMFV